MARVLGTLEPEPLIPHEPQPGNAGALHFGEDGVEARVAGLQSVTQVTGFTIFQRSRPKQAA